MDQKEHKQLYPKPGWVEHDPLEIWETTKQVIRSAVSKAGAQARGIAAVGVTNQRETVVVWDRRTGQPYYNAIVWQDTRTEAICHQLAEDGGQDRFRSKTGLPIATYFSGPKIMWILENIEGVREAAEVGNAIFGTVDSWEIWNLTGGADGGVHVTDVSNASRTLLMNLERLDWDQEVLDIMGIPRRILPRIVASSDPDVWAHTRADGPFTKSIPICGALGDQQAALLGQACFDAGEAKNTYGTGCFMLLNTGTNPIPSASGLLTTVAYKLGNQPAVYALEGSVAIAGALVQWLRDSLEFFENASDIEELASQVEDSGGVYVVPAFSGLFAPYWQTGARGVIAGLTSYTNKKHICRAALEATAYQTREVLDAMKQDYGLDLSSLKVDGGMVHNDLLMQFQADILGVPVVRSQVAETTALGAAYAAGLAIGFWVNLEELSQNWRADKTWEPSIDSEDRQELYNGWLKAVRRSMNWVDQE